MLFALLHTQGNPSLPTFHYEKSLPRLPLPPLRQTLDKYLQSLEPFFLHEEQLGGELASESRLRRQAWAQTFETGVGAQCQQRLQKLEESSPYNWFDDNFWLRKAYLENRQPLLINSNWWLALQDDPFAPEFVRT
ncbi:5532_t:CDS:2, partial [Acaulospora colombiana]